MLLLLNPRPTVSCIFYGCKWLHDSHGEDCLCKQVTVQNYLHGFVEKLKTWKVYRQRRKTLPRRTRKRGKSKGFLEISVIETETIMRNTSGPSTEKLSNTADTSGKKLTFNKVFW